MIRFIFLLTILSLLQTGCHDTYTDADRLRSQADYNQWQTEKILKHNAWLNKINHSAIEDKLDRIEDLQRQNLYNYGDKKALKQFTKELFSTTVTVKL